VGILRHKSKAYSLKSLPLLKRDEKFAFVKFALFSVFISELSVCSVES